nr:uncharacterized protein LOC109191529 [Ipomoea batatas]
MNGNGQLLRPQHHSTCLNTLGLWFMCKTLIRGAAPYNSQKWTISPYHCNLMLPVQLLGFPMGHLNPRRTSRAVPEILRNWRVNFLERLLLITPSADQTAAKEKQLMRDRHPEQKNPEQTLHPQSRNKQKNNQLNKHSSLPKSMLKNTRHRQFKAQNKMTTQSKRSVRDMGMGKLLDLNITNLPHTLGLWLVQNFDPRSCTLQLQNGQSVHITATDVAATLGLPMGHIEITRRTARAVPEILKNWRGIF